MSTNPILVPASLVSQFLATEKEASRHWLQCQMESLLDRVFDQLSTKFEDYVSSRGITCTGEDYQIVPDEIELQPPNEDEDAFLMDDEEPQIKQEFDDANNERIITDQNAQISIPVFAPPSNEQSNHNWTSENDEEYDLDGSTPDGLVCGDIGEVEVKEEIDYTNCELSTTQQPQNQRSLSTTTLNVEQSNENYDHEYGLNGVIPLNKHLKDGNDGRNEYNEKPFLFYKKQNIETTQPNNRQSRATTTRQSLRVANLNPTDHEQHINEQTNLDKNQQTEKENETNKVNNQDKNIITLSVQCLETGCPQMFPNKTELNDHMSTQHDSLPFRCLVKDCKQSFSTRNNLSKHIKQIHPYTTQWHCDTCAKHFTTYAILSSHNYLNHQLGQYQCTFLNCAFTAEYRSKVSNHYCTQHKIVELTCEHPDCRRRFSDNSNFKRHQQVHLGIKPYRCKWLSCGYASTHCPCTIAHIRRMHLNQALTETILLDPREYLEVLR